MICRVWQGVCKIDRKDLCSLHQPNGGFKVTHGCLTPTFQLSSLVLCLCLHEAPLLALRRMVRLYLILGVGPGDTIGGINSTNGWITVWEQLPNPNIDSDDGEDKNITRPSLDFWDSFSDSSDSSGYWNQIWVHHGTKSHSGLLLPDIRHELIRKV